jgi:hypothetical protein
MMQQQPVAAGRGRLSASQLSPSALRKGEKAMRYAMRMEERARQQLSACERPEVTLSPAAAASAVTRKLPSASQAQGTGVAAERVLPVHYDAMFFFIVHYGLIHLSKSPSTRENLGFSRFNIFLQGGRQPFRLI